MSCLVSMNWQAVWLKAVHFLSPAKLIWFNPFARFFRLKMLSVC